MPKLHLSLSWTTETGEPGRARLAATAFVTARPSVVIRRHRLTEVTLEELVARQMLTPLLASFLRACVRAGKSIVVSGPQGGRQDDPDSGAVRLPGPVREDRHL